MTDMNKPIQNFKQMLQEAADCLHGRNLNEASALAQEVIRLSKASGDYETYTRALNTLGVIQATLGNEGEAMDCYLAGLKQHVHTIWISTHIYFITISAAAIRNTVITQLPFTIFYCPRKNWNPRSVSTTNATHSGAWSTA